MKIKGLDWTSSAFTVGGGQAKMHEPLKFEVGRRYRAVARWRRRPLTREVYLIAPDGREFLAASNNNVPWGVKMGWNQGIDTTVHGTVYFGGRQGDIQIHAVRIHDNANPAPDEHRRPYVKKFRMEEFEAAK